MKLEVIALIFIVITTTLDAIKNRHQGRIPKNCTNYPYQEKLKRADYKKKAIKKSKLYKAILSEC